MAKKNRGNIRNSEAIKQALATLDIYIVLDPALTKDDEFEGTIKGSRFLITWKLTDKFVKLAISTKNLPFTDALSKTLGQTPFVQYYDEKNMFCTEWFWDERHTGEKIRELNGLKLLDKIKDTSFFHDGQPTAVKKTANK